MRPQAQPQSHPLSIGAFMGEPLRSLLQPVEPAIDKLFALDRLRELYRSAPQPENLLDQLQIRVEFSAAELAALPQTGPLLFVSNHPFGILDAAILTATLPQVRADLRIVANSMLRNVPELRERCIFVDNFGHSESVSANSLALRECLRWLRKGGALLTFPAGEVAHLDFRHGVIADPPWNPAAARLGQIARAMVAPLYFAGSNSPAFHFAGAIHPSLRTASLPRELLNKRGQRIELRIGRAVSAQTLLRFPDPAEACEYLRCRTYLLAPASRPGFPALRLPKRSTSIASPTPQSALTREISNLAPERLLSENGDLAVYVAKQSEFPAIVREIGRLREIAFRAVGEGSGREIDLDRFDSSYDHLALWNRENGEIAGAYRLAPATDVLARHGLGGLYTSTLFRYPKLLLDRIGPSVELGRSFIRPEYQKQYAPLLLLWKAIAAYVARRPECATLFGAVSISNDYHPLSRHLLVKYLECHRAEGLSDLVAPRHAYRPDERLFRRTGALRRAPADLDELSALIADLERDGKGVPILMRQYLKTGGRVLSLNVDRHFSDALDALIMVDLRTAPAALLDRYMGKERAAEFRAWHTARA